MEIKIKLPEQKQLRVKYFITRIQNNERISVHSGRVPLKQPQINIPRIQRSYYNDLSLHYYQVFDKKKNTIKILDIKDTPPKKAKRIIMFDYNNPSPLKYDFTSDKWEISNASESPIDQILRDRIMEDNVAVASMNVFMLDPAVIKIMVILAIIGVVVGIPLNFVFHLFPDTIIHWIP